MAQSLEQGQHQLTAVLRAVADLTDKVSILEGDPNNPIVRQDFLDMGPDADRNRMAKCPVIQKA